MDSCFYETIEETELLPVRFQTLHSVSGVFPAHWHKYIEILYLEQGCLTAVVQAKEYVLHPGSLMIINSGDLHMTRSEGCSYLLLQMSEERMQQFLPDFDTLHFDTMISFDDTADAKPLLILDDMKAIFARHEDGYQLLFTSRLYEFLYYLYRFHATRQQQLYTSGNSRDVQRVTQIMDWVQLHYAEPLTLDHAASSLALSREYFCRLFKKYTGQTFLEYLNDVRTIHLYADLKKTDDTVTVLMEKNGLSNYKVFMRTFKKLYGCTPQKIRKQ